MSAGSKGRPAPSTFPVVATTDTAVAPDRVSYLTVGDDAAGQRLDNFLLRLARGVPKSHVYRIVRSGEVRVNKSRATAAQRLQPGDEIRVPPLRLAQPAPVSGTAAAARAPMPPVLFEDEHLLAVDKPAGLAAHGGSGLAFGLIELVRAARSHQPFLELVHRLDRDTSGVLVLAKTRRALTAMHAALRDGRVRKRYLALVAGDWVNDRQHVRLALTKYLTRDGERRVAVDGDGMPSHTVIERVQRYGRFSLLRAELRTGRTHQIRVHLAHLGFPIVGDEKYGDFVLNRRVARGEFGGRLARMFLHSAAFGFAHPVGGGPIELHSPLPDDCGAFIEALEHARSI